MKTVSDIIEEFILSTIGEDEMLSISRNQLSKHFDCAPSQINYVLSTRFTLDRGYLIESRRGGGGYITVIKLGDSKLEYMNSIVSDSENEMTFNRASQIIDRLYNDGVITEVEAGIIRCAIDDKSLFAPKNQQKLLRAGILKNILTFLARKY